jgi:predicted enzyme related to lactoylglutathione lyase
MLATSSAVTWFEIPSSDLDRATRFYEDVLGIQLKPDVMGPFRMSIFQVDKGQPSGCVMQAEGYRPNAEGTTVYLNLRDDLAKPLAKVEKAGGKVLVGKTALPENMGYYAQFLDSEGNRVGFFSPR